MRTIFRPIVFLAFAGWLALMCSCSGRQNSPTAPTITANSSVPQGRVLLGVYNLDFGPDGEYSITEIRSGESHFNVTKSLFPPKCLDCFLAELIDKVGELWQFKFTIKNPFNITGYDCRVTLLKQGDILVLNPSSYTKVFALPTDSDPINPFLIFDSGNGQNEWGPGAQATSYVALQKPTGSKFTQISFAVDGSFPSNQEDPYILTNITAKPPSVNVDGSDGTNIAVTVLDWQNDVSTVTVDLSPLGGSGTAPLTNIFGNMWLIEDVHYKAGGLGVGTYNLLLTASSVGKETYNYVKVEVTEAGAPDFWVETDQETDKADTGQDVEFTAIPHNGTGPYYYEWDMDYDLITFNPDIGGETVKWHWSEVGTYNIRLKAESYDGQTATADTTIVVGTPGDGHLNWAKSAGGASGSYEGYGITTLSDNSTVVTGYFEGSATFGPGEPNQTVLTSAGYYDIFIARYNLDGTLIWAKRAGGPAFAEPDIGYGITALSDDSTVVTGYFSESATFGPGEPNQTVLTSAGQSDIFIACYNPDGSLVWAKRAGGPAYYDPDIGYGITSLSDDSTAVTGTFYESATFGPGEPNQTGLSTPGDYGFFVARYNTDGTLAWASSAGGVAGGDFGYGITALSDNSTVVTGGFGKTATFGKWDPNETDLKSVGWQDIFIARYNPDGTLAWAKRAGGDDFDYGNGITALSDNSTVVTGYFELSATFGPGEPNQTVLTSDGHRDIFIARYNPDGALAWAKRAGGIIADDCGNGITTLSDNSIVVTGSFALFATFGPGEPNQIVLTAAGWDDIFIARYYSDGTLAWAKRAGGTDRDLGYGITTLSDNSTVATGYFEGLATFGPDEPNQTVLTSAGWRDIFIARFAP